MSLVARLQTYLREVARQQYDAIATPPFTIFCHPSQNLIYFNYAIPDRAVAGEQQAALSALREAFAERGRRPRFEYIEEFAPELAPALREAGFVEDARLQLMVCTPETLQAPADVPGLTVTPMSPQSSCEEARDYLATARQGFDPSNVVVPSESEAEEYLRDARGAFLGRLDGEPAGVAAFMAPIGGVTEIAGIATREAYRRRGVASALTAYAARHAFEQGVEIACLSAADAQAGRVYERVGFRPYATMLFYLAPTE